MGVGKSNAKVYVQKETGVTFKDVAGEDEAKESLGGGRGFPAQSPEIFQDRRKTSQGSPVSGTSRNR